MRVEFTNPLALVLLALIPAALYFARHSLANLSRLRGNVSLGLRVLILLLIVMSLAGLRVRTASRDLALVFLVDVSASVAQDTRGPIIDFINSEIDRAGPRDYVSVVAFGREPSVELAPTRKEALADWRLQEISSNPPRDYTDIAAALRLAAALVPEDAVGRLVLVSDGNENLESATEEAQLLQASGIEVYARAIDTASRRGLSHGEIAVRDLAAPETLAEGEAFELKVTVDSTRDTDAVLRIYRNDSVASERIVNLTASGENVFVLPERVDQKGFYTYRAEVEAIQFDTLVQNNSREAFAIVEGRPKTLYLYGDPRPSPAIARVLGEGSFLADIRPASSAPTTLAGFQDYDLVIFDNVPASALTNAQMKMVGSYVRDLGGGFIMIGGDQSFGPGGYYKTPIEEALPVSLDVRQKKHLPSLAIALVIDKSGSMSGEKMEMTLEASSATVDFLSERDSVGVIAFDSDAYPVVNLTKVEDKKPIITQIQSIQALGGTNMYPGLKMAYDWLQSSDAQIKHIIVLSDGQSDSGDFRGIARTARDAGITVTTVAVGEDSDHQTMEMIASTGGGRFYAADSPETLPRIFTREAVLASRSTIIEEPFTPRLVRQTQATAGIDWSAAPMLGGYVGTAERDSMKSPAITSLISDKDDPVYAAWQYGLGRSAAFTSDAKSRWAAGWMNWPGFGQFWTQAFRDTLRREGATDLVPRVEVNAGRGHVTVEAMTSQGEFRNNLRLRAHVVAPDFSATDIQLEQTAAGRYEGDFTATARGAYLVNVAEVNGRPAPVSGAVNSYSPEFSITGSDQDLLARISEATGGRMIAVSPTGAATPNESVQPDESVQRRESEQVATDVNSTDVNLFERRATKTRPHEIWEALMLVALLLLPIDVGIRRVHITGEQLRHAREWIRSRVRRPSSAVLEIETPASLAQLKGARARVRLGDSDTVPPGVEVQAQEAVPAASRVAEQRKSGGARREASMAATDESPLIAGARAEDNFKVEKPATEAEQAQPLASRLLDARRKKRE
jgi:Ca-activated chloride channel homolog